MSEKNITSHQIWSLLWRAKTKLLLAAAIFASAGYIISGMIVPAPMYHYSISMPVNTASVEKYADGIINCELIPDGDGLRIVSWNQSPEKVREVVEAAVKVIQEKLGKEILPLNAVMEEKHLPDRRTATTVVFAILGICVSSMWVMYRHL